MSSSPGTRTRCAARRRSTSSPRGTPRAPSRAATASDLCCFCFVLSCFFLLLSFWRCLSVPAAQRGADVRLTGLQWADGEQMCPCCSARLRATPGLQQPMLLRTSVAASDPSNAAMAIYGESPPPPRNRRRESTAALPPSMRVERGDGHPRREREPEGRSGPRAGPVDPSLGRGGARLRCDMVAAFITWRGA